MSGEKEIITTKEAQRDQAKPKKEEESNDEVSSGNRLTVLLSGLRRRWGKILDRQSSSRQEIPEEAEGMDSETEAVDETSGDEETENEVGDTERGGHEEITAPVEADDLDEYILAPINQAEKDNVTPTVAIVFGQHQIAEHVAHEVGKRFSAATSLARDMELSFHEHDQGLCYMDSYEAAKGRARQEGVELFDPRFREIYHEEALKRREAARARVEKLATNNPDRLIIDLHETTRGYVEGQRSRDGLVFLADLDQEEVEELNRRLDEIFPDMNNQERLSPLELRAVSTRDYYEGDIKKPRNYVAIEMMTEGGDIYDWVSIKEGAWAIDKPLMHTNLVRPKDRDGGDLTEDEKITLSMMVNEEVTKYERLLERILPTVTEFYTEKVLTP